MHLRMFSLSEMRAWEPVLRKEYGSAGQGPKGSGRAGHSRARQKTFTGNGTRGPYLKHSQSNRLNYPAFVDTFFEISVHFLYLLVSQGLFFFIAHCLMNIEVRFEYTNLDERYICKPWEKESQ